MRPLRLPSWDRIRDHASRPLSHARLCRRCCQFTRRLSERVMFCLAGTNRDRTSVKYRQNSVRQCRPSSPAPELRLRSTLKNPQCTLKEVYTDPLRPRLRKPLITFNILGRTSPGHTSSDQATCETLEHFRITRTTGPHISTPPFPSLQKKQYDAGRSEALRRTQAAYDKIPREAETSHTSFNRPHTSRAPRLTQRLSARLLC